MSAETSLIEQRKRMAEASGGKSGGPCYDLALRLLTSKKMSGRLLDFGSGSGAFSKRLLAEDFAGEITCADILTPPSEADPRLRWITADLNGPLELPNESFEVVVSVEVIEHLENPRFVFREFHRLLAPGGHLIVTTPNQHSLRSLSGLIFGGHFALFLGANYPAHISALLMKDFERLCEETGFDKPSFAFTDEGRIPKVTSVSWQRISCGLLKGKLFSDGVAVSTKKLP